MAYADIELYPTDQGKVGDIIIDTLVIQSNPQILKYTSDLFSRLFDKDVKKLLKELTIKTSECTNSNICFLNILDKDCNSIYTVSSGSSQFELETCTNSLLNSALRTRTIVISNDYQNDPRNVSIDKISVEKEIETFMGIPISTNGKVFGILGLIGAKKYDVHNMAEILPIQRFLSQFVMLLKMNRLSVTKDLELKQEVITMKDSFIATMSHEIRTPLNGVVGMARLLSDSKLDQKQQNYVKILADCCTQLMELVNDILDFGKITSEELVLHSQSFILKTCIDSAIEIVSQRASDKNLKLRVDIPESLPYKVTGDSTRLKQVIINLLTNAIKFTEKGSIDLTVDMEKDTITNGYKKSRKFVFKVKDTGIGVAKKDQERIFEVFTKLSKEQGYTSTSPGAGMGLAISKYIVKAMNGDISVYSDGKNGSTFTFSVFLDDETDMLKMVDTYKNQLKGKSAIIVDDNEDNRIYLMETLYGWGIQTNLLSSARETLSFVDRDHSFDFAIIDLCMPNMSGIELTQTLRQKGYRQPIIGLSSIGSDIQGKEWFDYFNTKPISKLELFNLVLCCINKKETETTSEKIDSPSLSDEEGLKIIIAEDDYYNQIVILNFLESLGYSDVTVVGNGRDCVEKIKENRFDICFMDVKMPIMDGLDATRIIKELKHHPCVIAITASVQDSDKSRCFAAGMDGYLSKPIQKDELASVLERLSNNKSSA